MKPKTEFTKDDLGKLFTTDGSDVWRLDKFIPEPQLSMSCLSKDTEPVMEGLLSQFSDFVRLVPEQDPPKRAKRPYHRKVVEQVSGEALE